MRFLVIASLSLAAAILSFGCSAPASKTAGPNTGSVSGAVSSAKVTTVSAVARFGNYFKDESGRPARGLRILISDRPNSCAATHFASSTNLDLRVRAGNPGSYVIVDAAKQSPAAEQAEVDLNAVDRVCKDLVATAATGGTLHITAVEIHLTDPGSHVTGSIDSTFAGGHIAGDFDAVLCDESAADAGLGPDAGSPPVCSP